MCSLEKSGSIFILTLTGEDDERRLSPTLIESIRIALKQVRSTAKPGSVLITTAQGKFFSNGFDLEYAASTGSATRSDNRFCGMFGGFKFVIAELLSLPMPTVAAVSGHAAAAGFFLALSHDYVLMRKDKGVLYMSEDVLLRRMKIRADKAVEMGIVDFVYGTAGQETKEAAFKLAVKLGSNKWNGEVYADVRICCQFQIHCTMEAKALK
ncbi:hypothetical protein MKW98_022989 [Papaver atlanticum]|uniref:Enoyl-CoA delta isomerase 2, peroxisomal-like n=1 Tax=Papaver atlanticum TaxID=357466 RepID=A0AAD4XUA2_9MAGN|nr:hypothetical protein MKW98_022989 [Papaver atlanticum]